MANPTVRFTRTASRTIPVDHKKPAWRWVLSERSLERIAAYQYHSGPYTMIETAMNPYWNWIVHFLPMWAAPNLVTLAGLLWCVASYLVVLHFSPTLSDALPPWVCYFCTFSLFAYQTLDAVDGKQARRTGSSSPLGQLFDHGCDALNMVFTCTTLAGLWQLGTSPWLTLNVLFNVFIAFFMAQWEEYHTGTMMTSNGVVGVTEGQFIQMGIGLFTAWFGADLWGQEVLSLQWGDSPVSLSLVMTVKALAMAGGTLLTLWVSISSMTRVFYTHTSGKLSSEEVGEKELGKFYAIWHLLPAMLSFTLGAMWTVGHGQAVFKSHNTVVVAALGITVAYLSTRMTVMHMAKQPFGHAELLLPIVLQCACVVNTYWQVLDLPRVGSFPVDEEKALYWYTAAVFLIYSYFVMGVIHDICVFLDIHCFRIKAKSAQPAASS